MKVWIVLQNYSDGSPAVYTSIEGVHSTEGGARTQIDNSPYDETGGDGCPWLEVEEWDVETPEVAVEDMKAQPINPKMPTFK